MTALLIDIGNTRLKWGLESAAGFTFGGGCESQVDVIEGLYNGPWAELKPDSMLISCVGNKSIERCLVEQASTCWGIRAELLVSPQQGCGITNAYARPASLGSDRFAAMVAAYRQVKGPVCVVSSGTAVTLDAVDNDGRHLGGLILPGYGLMQVCLQKETQLQFPVDLMLSGPAGLGQSTDRCIQQGTAMAISSMVDKMVETLKYALPGIRLLLTGGDAGLLQRWLCHDASLEPHLVLKGLAFIYHEHSKA